MTAPAPEDEPTYADGIPEFSIEGAVQNYLKKEAPKVVLASVEDIKIARASDGSYWASAWAIPKSSEVDSQVVFLHKTDSTWQVVDYGSGIDGSELPEDVRSALWSD